MNNIITAVLMLICTSFLSAMPSAKGNKGQEIKIVEADEALGLYLFEISGFLPGEKVQFISQSLHEVIHNEVTMPQDGKMHISLLPAVIGYSKGQGSITLIG